MRRRARVYGRRSPRHSGDFDDGYVRYRVCGMIPTPLHPASQMTFRGHCGYYLDRS
jgi:hypothetical protein